MTKDPFDTPEWRAYARSAREDMLPKMKGSAVTMALLSGTDPDPKMACELGYMIMLNKPIIAVVTPGVKVPDKLVLVADEIVEGEMDDPDFRERLMAAIARVQAKSEET